MLKCHTNLTIMYGDHERYYVPSKLTQNITSIMSDFDNFHGKVQLSHFHARKKLKTFILIKSIFPLIILRKNTKNVCLPIFPENTENPPMECQNYPKPFSLKLQFYQITDVV